MSVSNSNLLRIWPCFLLAFLLALGGCGFYDDGETVSEEQERAYQRGKQLQREGRQEDALNAFLRVVERRPSDAPESHLEAAAIYLDHLEDPVEAIHHFRRYLEQKPHSAQAELVRGQINRAMKELARTLPGEPLQHPMERLELLATVEELESENSRLRSEVTSLREARQTLTDQLNNANSRAEQSRLSAPSGESQSRGTSTTTTAEAGETRASANPQSSESPSRSRTYIVRQGDNLYGISRTVYGTPSRWREIYEANRDVLPDENSVPVGMRLQIPLD